MYYETQFIDFKNTAEHIKIFENLFTIKVTTLSLDLELKIIKITSNNELKVGLKERVL